VGVYEVVQQLGSKNMVKTLGLSIMIEVDVAVYLVEIFYFGVLWGPLPPDAASRRGQPYTGAGHLTQSVRMVLCSVVCVSERSIWSSEFDLHRLLTQTRYRDILNLRITMIYR
jgi:hypothetical protein